MWTTGGSGPVWVGGQLIMMTDTIVLFVSLKCSTFCGWSKDRETEIWVLIFQLKNDTDSQLCS